MDEFFSVEHHDKTPDGLFEKQDKNKDGKIDWFEFQGSKGRNPPRKKKLSRPKVKM